MHTHTLLSPKGSKHVTHRLEISFGYTKHYLDVFRLMSNLQVTYVDVCQRSRNVPTTYASICDVCHTSSTSRNFQHTENFSTYSAYKDVCQRTTTYASVLLTYTKLTHNVFDVCQLGSANFSYVGIRWLKRQGVTAA